MPELGDARAALDWAERHALTDAIDFFLATSLWVQLGLNREAIDRAKRLAALLDEGDDGRRARLWERIAVCAAGIGHNAIAQEGAERAVRYARKSNDRGILADCLLRYADVVARARRFDEAVAAVDEAEALGQSSLRRDQQAHYARALIGLLRGDLDAAAASFARAHEVFASSATTREPRPCEPRRAQSCTGRHERRYRDRYGRAATGRALTGSQSVGSFDEKPRRLPLRRGRFCGSTSGRS